MSIRHARFRLWALVGAFVAVAVSFLAANAVTQHAMRRIDSASDDIAFNSAPSIEHLAALRSAARQTQFLVGTLFTTGEPGNRVAVEVSLATMNAEANAYLKLPTFKGETAFWHDLGAAIAALNGAVQRTLAEFDAGAFRAARADLAHVASSADRVSDAAARATEFNARNGRELALRIKGVRREAAWIAYALTSSCALFALLAGLLVQRGWRRYSDLIEEHAELQESRARELEAFAGRAAHDILNPVSATQMALTLAARRGADPRAAELFERATRNLQRVRTIIDGLFQFARAGARPVPGVTADLASVLDDVVAGIRPAAEGAGIEVRVEPVPSCAVGCSAGVLTSAVSNLAQNAVRYVGDGARPPRIVLRASSRSGIVRVEVEDTGPGIAPELRDAIFLPYVRGPTSDRTGLGLGLATVKRLCEAHGGRVGVRSTVGEGSTFWLELPAAAELGGAPDQAWGSRGRGAERDPPLVAGAAAGERAVPSVTIVPRQPAPPSVHR